MVTLELPRIAACLEGLEETIINRLIDRAQFAANAVAYRRGESGFTGAGDRSLFDMRLRYQEEMDAAFGRFQVPEERPFHRDLPPSRRVMTLPESPLAVSSFDAVNLTRRIVADYRTFLPRLCQDGDDGHYGSSVEHDVLAIQALARRVHYGALYVAESKYRAEPAAFDRLVDERDERAIIERITRPEVEERILVRVAEKVTYIQATANRSVRRHVTPEVVLELYRDTIIPLTKEGELLYLFNRVR